MVVSNVATVVVKSGDVVSVVDCVVDCADDVVVNFVDSTAFVVEFRIGSGGMMSKQS